MLESRRLTVQETKALNKYAMSEIEKLRLNRIYYDIARAVQRPASQQVSYKMEFVSSAMRRNLERNEFYIGYNSSSIVISW